MTWTRDNWKTWEKEKPAWFTDHFISTVPDEFIPVAMDLNRRRSSIFGGVDVVAKTKSEKRGSSKVYAADSSGSRRGAGEEESE